jgi:hypothetical protein
VLLSSVFILLKPFRTGGDLLQLNGYQSSKAFASFDVQTLMRAIEQVEKKLDGLGSKVIEKLDSVSKRMEESFKNDFPIKANMHSTSRLTQQNDFHYKT